MPKLPKRLPYEAALIASLMLGSCAKLPQTFTGEDAERLETADVSARNTIDRTDELRSRVEAIEERLNM